MVTREEWLSAAAVVIRAELKSLGLSSVVDARASCGWPHKHGASRTAARVGECWHPSASSSGVAEIFISPVLGDSLDVAATLAHELVHALVGTECGHKGAFVKWCRALGLEGKPSATVAGEAFLPLYRRILEACGKYPHSYIDVTVVARERAKVKQDTRMLKCVCDDCGYTVRASRKWLDKAGAPLCPCNRRPMGWSGKKDYYDGELDNE